MKLEKLIEQAYETQAKYAAPYNGPADDMPTNERYQKVVEMLGHIIEEVVEARQCVPRRSWRKDEVGYLDNRTLFDDFVSELADVQLFLLAAIAWAGVDPDVFCEALKEKRQYNTTRADHWAD